LADRNVRPTISIIMKHCHFFFLFCLSLVFGVSSTFALQKTLYPIKFGGTDGANYIPSDITIEVGDTIVWNGSFATYSLESTSVPVGADPFGPINTGTSFQYVVQVAGTYTYQNKTFAALGMKGSFTAVFKSHGSITNEGREFYIGMIYPTYNNIVPKSLANRYVTNLLITTYYDNTVYISYFDDNGKETTPTKKTIAARHVLTYPISSADFPKILDTTAEVPAFKSCHIVSQYPVTVQYISKGCNSGGSYLALPTLGLGKNYVISSYNDNVGNGAMVSNSDVTAAGSFMVIAPEDITSVTVIPSTKTSATSVSSGHPQLQPFSIGLSRGQCCYIRSDGKDGNHDLSGTRIISSKPIVVISGHEDGYLGDGACYRGEGRDLMIEQMLPVEYWDSVGYMSVPFTEGNKGNSTCGGNGDTYRVLTFDPGTASAHVDVSTIPGGYDMSTSQYNVAEHLDIQAPVDIYSTNAHKISVMQYDERSQTQGKPYPSPSMMTVIPHSRWRYSYNFGELPVAVGGAAESQYINVLSENMQSIYASAEGGAEILMTSLLTQIGTYNNVSTHSTNVKGGRFTLTPDPFYLHSDYPFVCYLYGMSEVAYSTGGGGGGGAANFESSYATPAGMQLNTGVPPAFKVTTTILPDCAGWKVCVSDTGHNNPGIKAVMLVDDLDGVYFQRPRVKYQNVSFDNTSQDFYPYSTSFIGGELHPDLKSNAEYCFTINIDNKLAEAKAPIGLIDNNGNGLLIQLHKDAPTVKLLTFPASSVKPDSMVFPQQTVGNQVCTSFVVRNTAPAGGSPLMFTGAKLAKNDAAYQIQNMTPSLPHSINAQDSLVVRVCFSALDTKRHRDSLIISNDCFDIPISLDGSGATGTIVADDITFGNLDSGLEINKTLLIRNNGLAPFTIKPSPSLSDNVNFAIDPMFLSSLPLTLPPSGKVTVKVFFHPQKPGSDSAMITWGTDIDAGSASAGTKSYSILKGVGLKVIGGGGVTRDFFVENSFSVRPNPASGSTAIVSFSVPSKTKATIAIFDVLGREMFTRNYNHSDGEYEIPIGYLQQGIYYVRLTSEDLVATQKLEVVR
jgi:plastocyanin